MKQFLLLFFLLTTSAVAFGQSSLSERLAYQSPDPAERVTVYPNPATSHIGLNDTDGVDRIVVFNMIGRQMRAFEAGDVETRYFIGDLPRGMYLVQIIGKNQEVVTTKRLRKL